MRDETRRRFQQRMAQYREHQTVLPALLGDGQGNVNVSGRPGYVYVRVGSEDLYGQAFNSKVPAYNDLPVLVGWDDLRPNLFQVLAIRQVYLGSVDSDVTIIPEVGPHALTHMFPTIDDSDSGGSDVVYTAWRQIRGMHVKVDSGFTVSVERTPVYRPSGWVWIATQQIDLTSAVPDYWARYVLVYLDIDGVFQSSNGGIVAKDTIDISDCPAPPEDSLALAAILLYAGQTGIHDDRDEQNIIDVRWPPSLPAAELPVAGIGGYVRGSIIRGGAGDWEVYDAKTDHFILVGDGTDIASKAFDWDDLAAGTAADMVHDHSSAAEGGTVIPATSVEVDEIGAATYDDVQDWINNTQSAGYISGGLLSAHSDAITAANDGGAGAGSFEVADDQTAGYGAGVVITVSGSTGNDGDYTVSAGGATYAAGTTTIPVDEAVPDGTADGDIANGTVDITAVKGFLKTTDSEIGVTQSFDLAATANLALTDALTNYVFVNYVGGPKFDATTTRSDVEFNRQFTLGRVYRDGTTLHIIQSGVQLHNFLREEHERVVACRGFEQASGGAISETGNRFLESTAGVFYLGRNTTTTTGKDTDDGDTFTRWYHVGGVWASDQKSQICAAAYQYDDGTDLANVTKYGVWWVFVHFDSDLHVVVGRGNYTLAQAQAATLPGTPSAVGDFSALAARVIVKNNGVNFAAIQSAYEVFFPLNGAFDHNDLGSIQGGAADDYYHLTAVQHKYVRVAPLAFSWMGV